MKRFLSLCAALPLLGCGQSFFVRVDLTLDTRDVELLAINPGQLREVQVQAIPGGDSGLEPVSFVVTNNGAPFELQGNGVVSYTLELPPELAGEPLKLVHRGFSIDPNIDTPLLFGELDIVTEQQQINGAALGINDPRCNGVDDPDDFCPKRTTSDALTPNHSGMIDTQTNSGGSPVVLIINDEAQTLQQMSVRPDGGLTSVSGGDIDFPSPVSIVDLSLVNVLGNAFTVAILQSDQVFLRNSVTGGGVVFAAPGLKAITAADLDLTPGGNDIAGITGTAVEVFSANSAGDFNPPKVFNIASAQGAPVLLATRRGQPDQIAVATTGQAPSLLFFDFFGGSIRQLPSLALPGGTQPVALAFRDLDGDDIGDALLLDNGVNKRVFVMLLEPDGKLKANGQSEIALSGDLRSVVAGKFDNNGSQDIAVSGSLGGEDFVQFILSSSTGRQVTPPRKTEKGPSDMVSLRISSEVEVLVVETVGSDKIEAFTPER